MKTPESTTVGGNKQRMKSEMSMDTKHAVTFFFFYVGTMFFFFSRISEFKKFYCLEMKECKVVIFVSPGEPTFWRLTSVLTH